MPSTKAFVRKSADTPPTACPCGQAARVVTAADGTPFSVHRVEIAGAAKRHYHKILTECYVVLDGQGEVELDGERIAVEPGDMIYIPPPTKHALRGHFTIINIVSPPFRADDEYVVE